MVDLGTRYLGLDLRSPLVASASPLTGSLDDLRRLEAAGAAAVVLPSLFEEQLTQEAREVGRLLEAGADSLSAAVALDDYNAGPYGYLALVEKAKATLEIPVIASLNGVSRGAWVEHATLLEQAGADAVELNIYFVSSSPGWAARTSSSATWTWSARCARRSASRWRSSSAPTSAQWPTWPASWSRRAPTGWCCSTASTSPTWTSTPWR
jgi:dihydroorotate dehydrogenase